MIIDHVGCPIVAKAESYRVWWECTDVGVALATIGGNRDMKDAQNSNVINNKSGGRNRNKRREKWNSIKI